jgi:hypothetical protein
MGSRSLHALGESYTRTHTQTMYKSTHFTSYRWYIMLHIIIIRRDDPLIFETAPLLLRSSPCEVPRARVDWYQYNNIMFTARTQARDGLGRVFCEAESVFLRPHLQRHRRRRHRGEMMVSVNHSYYRASGSDLRFDEREQSTDDILCNNGPFMYERKIHHKNYG